MTIELSGRNWRNEVIVEHVFTVRAEDVASNA